VGGVYNRISGKDGMREAGWLCILEVSFCVIILSLLLVSVGLRNSRFFCWSNKVVDRVKVVSLSVWCQEQAMAYKREKQLTGESCCEVEESSHQHIV